MHAASEKFHAPRSRRRARGATTTWNAAIARLRDRGLVDDDGTFTTDGAAFRQAIEDRTDLLAMAPWLHLGEDGCDELRALVRPLSKAVVAATDFTFDN